ncbi:MAG: hypothetical protein U0414_19645 [Polyangiaceae bacterium]
MFVPSSHGIIEPKWMESAVKTVGEACKPPTLAERPRGASSLWLEVPEGNETLQATHGNVSVNAHKEVKVQAVKKISIVADPGAELEGDGWRELDPAKIDGFKKGVTDTTGKVFSNKLPKYLLTLGDLAAATSAFYFTRVKPWTESPAPGRVGWLPKHADRAKWCLDVLKIGSSVARWGQDLASWDKGTDASNGSVDIFAATNAGLTGAEAASVYGNLSASLSSLLSASVLGMTAGVRGLLWASVWGLDTSIKGMHKVGLSSDLGKADIKGELGVSVSSASGKGTFAGKKGVEITASEGKAVMVAKEEAYVGAGGAAGYALAAKSDGATLGFRDQLKTFGAALNTTKGALTVENAGVRAEIGQTKLELKSQSVVLESPGDVTIGKAGLPGIKMKRQRVMLG